MTDTAELIKRLDEIKRRHGPQKPGHCSGGMRIGADACEHCGATTNDTCGKWMLFATEDIETLIPLAEKYVASLARQSSEGERKL